MLVSINVCINSFSRLKLILSVIRMSAALLLHPNIWTAIACNKKNNEHKL